MSRHVKEPMQRGRRSEPFSELCLFAGIMLSDLGFCSGVTPNHEPSMIWPVVGTGEGHGAFCHRSTGEGSRGGASWPRWCCWGRLIGGGGSNEGSIAASSSGRRQQRHARRELRRRERREPEQAGDGQVLTLSKVRRRRAPADGGGGSRDGDAAHFLRGRARPRAVVAREVAPLRP